MYIRVALGPHLHFNPTSADGQGSLEPHGAIFSRFSAEYQDYIKKNSQSRIRRTFQQLRAENTNCSTHTTKCRCAAYKPAAPTHVQPPAFARSPIHRKITMPPRVIILASALTIDPGAPACHPENLVCQHSGIAPNILMDPTHLAHRRTDIRRHISHLQKMSFPYSCQS